MATGQDHAEERPFQAVVPPRAPVDPSVPADSSDRDWSADEIEQAYRKALEAADVPELAGWEPEPISDDPFAAPPSAPLPLAVGVPHATATATAAEASPDPRPITPRQIVEALLFVGGKPLTSRALCDVVGGSTTQEQIEDQIAAINGDYASQNRPYEVRLVEGGYCLTLRSSFEKVRNRVFGAGPREVKLSQDALEVLAFVAYQQPVTADALEETGKQNASGLLRQLLRRELVALKRGDDPGNVRYETTPRFLELFGLTSLRDLPRAEQINLR
jgi:segregation and condensation protein B